MLSGRDNGLDSLFKIEHGNVVDYQDDNRINGHKHYPVASVLYAAHRLKQRQGDRPRHSTAEVAATHANEHDLVSLLAVSRKHERHGIPWNVVQCEHDRDCEVVGDDKEGRLSCTAGGRAAIYQHHGYHEGDVRPAEQHTRSAVRVFDPVDQHSDQHVGYTVKNSGNKDHRADECRGYADNVGVKVS